MHEILSSVLSEIVHYAALAIEFVGVVILIAAAVMGIVRVLRRKEGAALGLARGIALALEFLMVGEVLHTILVREWKEAAILGSILAMRIAMTVLIHWEIKKEKEEKEEEKEE